jgi:folate-binding protein YgfZ
MHILSDIKLTGPDAFQFLQGQVSNDLRRLENEAEILAAWCNPKGRVIWFGTIRQVDGGYRLSAPAEMAEDIVKRLTMFRFRSKLEFELIDTGKAMDPHIAIERGYPFIGAQQSGQFTPHMLNLDLLDAISFDKGCYPGQEIVARTHYKGATKRRALRFSCDKAADVGDKVSLDERDIGEVLNVAGNDLLAVVPTDKADEALTIGGIPLERKPLPYL